MRVPSFLRRVLAPLGVGLVVASSACYKSTTGPDPDDHAFYYPVGVALSPSGNFLFVANSNFDLRFNAGTVQALRLHAGAGRPGIIDEAKKCAAGNGTACTGANIGQFVQADVRVGAFAADLRVIPRGVPSIANGGRILVPVRGDASLTAIDYDENADGGITLRCTGAANPNDFGARCEQPWLLGTDPGSNTRGLTLEGEPFSVAAWSGQFGVANKDPAAKDPFVGNPANGIAAVVHQSTGDVSLFVNTEDGREPPTSQLSYVIGGLHGGATAIAPFPAPEFGTQSPRFIVTNDTFNTVAVLQYFPDPTVDRAGLVLAAEVALPTQSTGYDSRGVVVDPPSAIEARPTRVFVTNRTPPSLIVGQLDSIGNLFFFDNVPLPVGASRLTRASIKGTTKILAASYDARAIAVYDPDARRLTNLLLTHRGPYALAVDEADGLVFVCNFTDSTIQVLDLAAERIIYSVGVPYGQTG